MSGPNVSHTNFGKAMTGCEVATTRGALVTLQTSLSCNGSKLRAPTSSTRTEGQVSISSGVRVSGTIMWPNSFPSRKRQTFRSTRSSPIIEIPLDAHQPVAPPHLQLANLPLSNDSYTKSVDWTDVDHSSDAADLMVQEAEILHLLASSPHPNIAECVFLRFAPEEIVPLTGCA